MALARITVTLPARLVKDAGARARQEHRSRSWVVAEALRRYLHERELAAPETAERAGAAGVREAPAVDYDALGAASAEARLQHLASDLRLSPAARLTRAEELGELAREQQHREPREQVIAFSGYDDYYRWKLARLVGA